MKFLLIGGEAHGRALECGKDLAELTVGDDTYVTSRVGVRDWAVTFYRLASMTSQQAATRYFETVVQIATENAIPVGAEVVFDFPTAWKYVLKTKREWHHEGCSYRTHGMLCDCAMIDGIQTLYKDLR